METNVTVLLSSMTQTWEGMDHVICNVLEIPHVLVVDKK